MIVVSWGLCDCPPAVAACRGGPPGHLAVYCAASPGCRSVWYRPRCERRRLGAAMGTRELRRSERISVPICEAMCWTTP